MVITFKSRHAVSMFLYMLREYIRAFGVLPMTHVIYILNDLYEILVGDVTYHIPFDTDYLENMYITKHFEYEVFTKCCGEGDSIAEYTLILSEPLCIFNAEDWYKTEEENTTDYINHKIFPGEADNISNGLSEAIIDGCKKFCDIDHYQDPPLNILKKNFSGEKHITIDTSLLKNVEYDPEKNAARQILSALSDLPYEGTSIKEHADKILFGEDKTINWVDEYWKRYKKHSLAGTLINDKPKQKGYNFSFCFMDENIPTNLPEIEKVIYNGIATVVWWKDNTKTVVKCQEGDIYDPEKGLAMAIAKKALGNNNKWFDTFKKYKPNISLERACSLYNSQLKEVHNKIKDNFPFFKKDRDFFIKDEEE